MYKIILYNVLVFIFLKVRFFWLFDVLVYCKKKYYLVFILDINIIFK